MIGPILQNTAQIFSIIYNHNRILSFSQYPPPLCKGKRAIPILQCLLPVLPFSLIHTSYITYSLSFSSSDSFFFSDSCSQHSKYSLSFRKTSFRTSYRPVVLSFCIADIHRIRILHLSTLVRSSGTYPFENKFPTQFH